MFQGLNGSNINGGVFSAIQGDHNEYHLHDAGASGMFK
jgi:hypothetical protein